MEEVKITEELIKSWEYGYDDNEYLELVESMGYNADDLTYEQINELVEKIDEQYPYQDEQVIGYDVYQGSVEKSFYFKHNGKFYGIDCVITDWNGVELACDPYEVVPEQRTITVYTRK